MDSEQLKKEKAVAGKFVNRIYELMKDEPLIENNATLQKRIQDAAGYFIPVIAQLKDQLQKHPLVTEHKEVALSIDETLIELMHDFIKTTWYLQYCTMPFSVTGFLKHKLDLAIPRVQITSYAANKKTAATSDIPNPELYFNLKSWRDQICQEQNIPIYMLANSNSLKEICMFLPLTKNHLMLLSGFGKAKAEKYGDEIIEMVDTYCNQYGLESHIELKEVNPKRQRKEPSKNKVDKTPSGMVSLQYYKQGKTINEIANERNLTTGTIESHLSDFIKTGEILIQDIIDDAKVKIISDTIKNNPQKRHAEIKSILGDDYSYSEIRAVANHLLWLGNK